MRALSSKILSRRRVLSCLAPKFSSEAVLVSPKFRRGYRSVKFTQLFEPGGSVANPSIPLHLPILAGQIATMSKQKKRGIDSSSSSAKKRSSSKLNKTKSDPKVKASTKKARATTASDGTGTSEESNEDASYEQLAGVDPSQMKIQLCGVNPNGEGFSGASPSRNAAGTLHFTDRPEFKPNLTPSEVLHLGSFGGGYFRPIHSKITGKSYKDVYKELPPDWLKGLDIATQVASTTYRKTTNKYKVNCGAKVDKADTFGLDYWESKNWISAQDPYGWFHWYCRFFQGRRSEEDSRQIDRWNNCAGPKGRWKQNLVGKVMKAGARFDDEKISPVVRQTLQHWAYRLTESDFRIGAKRVEKFGAPYRT